MNEFDVIGRYFEPLTQGHAGTAGLRDDAAVLKIPAGHELVITSDTLNAATHFPVEAPPGEIARKALRVNISDLAAMGADPFCYQLNIAFLKSPDEDWLKAFTGALAGDQEEFGIFCSGGDTTRTGGPFSVSITALGLVPEGQAVRRSGAQAGDLILLTGPVGDAYLGLQVLKEGLDTPDKPYFIDKYYRPKPRHDLAPQVRAYAHAAIDISDGFVADLEHICTASGLAAEAGLETIGFSAQALKILAQDPSFSPEDLLTGGDDYELILAVPPEHADKFPGAFAAGRFSAGASHARILDEDGREMSFSSAGWTHF